MSMWVPRGCTSDKGRGWGELPIAGVRAAITKMSASIVGISVLTHLGGVQGGSSGIVPSGCLRASPRVSISGVFQGPGPRSS